MIRINLLPHREAKRKQNQIAFYRLLGISAIFGIVIFGAVAAFLAGKILEQEQRNTYIKAENAHLDEQIAEIANLKQEIEALKARQQAVEDLQSDRNQPVYLLDELVKQIPEGIFLRSFKQEGQRVSMNGIAQSNERVAELLHNFTSESPWLEHPELVEIRATTTGSGKEIKRVYEFTLAVGIKRPGAKDKDKDKGTDKPGAPAANSQVPAGGAAKPTPAASAAATPNAATAGGPAGKISDKPVVAADKASAIGKPADSAKVASDAGGHGAVDAPKKP